MELATAGSARTLLSDRRGRPGSREVDKSLRPRAGGFAGTLKRIIDVGGAALALVLLLPAWPIIAAAIRCESRGPALFRQRRVGLHGRTFEMLKFRTMSCDSEARLGEIESLNESPGGVLFLVRNDPRVTRVGRFLRRTSLDELPQLINVLRGEMSLVGPRPLQLLDAARIADLDPVAAGRRLAVLPGLTGLAQVEGRRELAPRRILELDREYVERWSLAADLAILRRTVGVVLSGRGAI